MLFGRFGLDNFDNLDDDSPDDDIDDSLSAGMLAARANNGSRVE